MNACPECGSKVVKKKGIGVEVIGEEFKKKFPKKRVAVFHTDEAGNKRRQEDILSHYKDGKIDILVGTSMLAHRLDLPPASMVVIFYPEITLALSEHLKKDKDSRAVIKTAMPNNFSIKMAASGDYHAFYEQEIQYRRIMNYPPFSCMAEIVFQDENLRVLAEKSRQFAARVKKKEDIEVLGPALAPVARVRGRNRIQVILKAKGKKEIDSVLKSALSKSHIKKSVYIYE
jgi:primosomal protein N' (replication factor Y)